MEISDQTHKLSCDFIHNSHGTGCKFRRSSWMGRRTTGGARRRLRWDGSDMASPVVQWRLNGLLVGSAAAAGGGKGRIRRVRGSGVVVGRSARKLAAGLWHLAPVRNCGGGGVKWHGQHGRFDHLQFGLDSHLPMAKTGMEEATKWDRDYFNASPVEVCQFHNQAKFLKNQQVATISVAHALQVELVRTRDRVKELETERHLFKKKIKQFLRELSHEKACWIRRERKKMFLIIEELKGELERERRNCQKMENVNSKLLSELADAKLYTNQILQDCEKEKNTRQFLEDVCRGLGKDIEEHKANIRAMKIECARIQEEVEEERTMMQLAEVWREERLQMKLVDAKLILEEKYFQMNSLIAELENLLRSDNANPDAIKVIEARGLAMDSLSIQDIKELCYTLLTNNVHAIFENPQDSETIETGIDECRSQLSVSQSSEFHNVNPEANESTKNLLCGHSEDNSTGNARFRETKTHMVGDCSRSADTTNGASYIPSASIGKDGNANQGSLNPKTNKITSGQKLKNKGPSIRKIWKSSRNAAGVLKTIPIDENGRRSDGSNSSIFAVSQEKLSQQDYNHNKLVNQWRLPGQRNPHISRAMTGCIEWPRGIQKNGLKAKLLEAKLRNSENTVADCP